MPGGQGAPRLHPTMSAKNASRDTPANPSKESPECRGRDGREAAHDDETDEQANNPPTHHQPTHGLTAFLLWVGKTGRSRDLDDLADHYQAYKRKNADQADLAGWSE